VVIVELNFRRRKEKAGFSNKTGRNVWLTETRELQDELAVFMIFVEMDKWLSNLAMVDFENYVAEEAVKYFGGRTLKLNEDKPQFGDPSQKP